MTKFNASEKIFLTGDRNIMPILLKKVVDIIILTFYIIVINYLINIIKGRPLLLSKDFFLKPQDPMQRRYEALRALVVEELSLEEVSQKSGYSLHTLRALKRDFNKNILSPFFVPLKRGPKEHRKSTLQIKEGIISLRKRNYSIKEIQEALHRQGEEISLKTIYILLEEEGFAKLFRRTRAERREALQSGRDPAQVADVKRFADRREVSTDYGGVFLFVPLICELGLDKLFRKSSFYGSKQIPRVSYLLSYLVLKLLGKERLCHINNLNFDYGIGLFAGLNVLPKAAAVTQYSYRHPHSLCVSMLRSWTKVLSHKGYLRGHHINLDFHSIPHYGEESQLESHWIPTRSKTMKSVLSFFAQDLDTTYLCYSNGDIKKEHAADEVLAFVSFYRKATGKLPQYLVFDSKLTTYSNLNRLNQQGIFFITLKRRGKKIRSSIEAIRQWQMIRLDIPSRKHQLLRIHEANTTLAGYEGHLRQIVVTGTGRELPMLLITNDSQSQAKELIGIYAKRWRIENNLQENVDFFNLNALSSPVVVKVDFDIAITLIANTLYKTLSSQIRLFEKAKAKTLFRNFVEGGATITLTPKVVQVRFEKKSHNPLIMDWVKNLKPKPISWMGNRTLAFSFE
jgi:transposase